MKSNSFKLLALLSLSLSLQAADVLVFSNAYKYALENSHSLKSSTYLLESEKEKINLEESQLYPQIKLSASVKSSRYQYHDDFPTNNDKTLKQNQFNATASLRQSVYTPTTYTKISAQELKSDYSKIKVKLEKEELAQEVFTSYLDVLKSRSKMELLKSYIAFNKVKYTKIKQQFEKNLSNKMDLLEMKVEYDTALINLKREEKLFNSYTLKLKYFIGNVDYTLPKLQKSDVEIVNLIEKMRMQVDTIKKSLKVTQAELSAEISQKNIDLAKDGHLPTVSFDALFSKYEMNNPDVTAPYTYTTYAMLTANIPLYSGGYTSSQVASAKLEHKAALEEVRQVDKETKVSYVYNMAVFNASADSVQMYRDSLASSTLYVKAVDEGFKQGLKSIIDLDEAKNKFYEVKYKYVENLYEMVNSYITLLVETDNIEGIALLDTLIEK